MNLTIFMLCFMHILGDFYLQSDKISKCKIGMFVEKCSDCEKCKDKKHINYLALLIHVVIYCIPYLLLFFIIKWHFVFAIIAIVFATHYLIDVVSCYLKKYWDFATATIVIDQVLHMATLIGIYLLISNCFGYHTPNFIIKNENNIKKLFMVFLLVKPISILIDCIFKDLFYEKPSNNYNDSQEALVICSKKENNYSENVVEKKKHFDVGSVIGDVERLIILLLAVLNYYSSIAIIITIKTWARSNDIKNIKGFGNKYLVGTLLSLLFGLAIGYWFSII